MKISLLLFIIFISGMKGYSFGYDYDLPVKGESLANNTLQSYIVKDLYKVMIKKYPSCYDFKVEDTQVLRYPYDMKKDKKSGRYIEGFWQEFWTFNACERKIQIPLSFKITKKNTEYFYDKGLLPEI